MEQPMIALQHPHALSTASRCSFETSKRSSGARESAPWSSAFSRRSWPISAEATFTENPLGPYFDGFDEEEKRRELVAILGFFDGRPRHDLGRQ